MLTGSGFALNREAAGGTLSFWSGGAQSSFAGSDGDLALDGDVRTTMFGADYRRGPLVTGLSLAHSRGLGGFAGADAGRVSSAVTGLYPWLGYKATERVTVWGVAGYGAGGMLLTSGMSIDHHRQGRPDCSHGLAALADKEPSRTAPAHRLPLPCRMHARIPRENRSRAGAERGIRDSC